MITRDGYSKDPGIRPEALVITFGKEMMLEQGGVKQFLSSFLTTMNNYDLGGYWMHKCKNLPIHQVDIIYIIVLNRLWGKVYCGGYKKFDPEYVPIGYTADGLAKAIDFNYLVLSGPLERCPFKRELKGFQGIRYATFLF